jgi:hypothetical protein
MRGLGVSGPRGACLLIADISGYTTYLGGVELDHAQDILGDLIGAVVSSLRPTFKLAKLEGDAAFVYTPTDRVDGSLLLDTVERCYFAFRRRRRDVRQATNCECNACVRIPTLDLKFVVHHGLILQQRIAGREELLGADVILVHRMLKNEVSASTGIEAYALLTQACVDVIDVDPPALGMVPYSGTYDVGEVRGWIHDLGRRWEEEESRERVYVGSADALMGIGRELPVPPQIAWEFITTPGRRASWQSRSGVTGIELVSATGNRRGVGATNHCMHGKEIVIEEILDWRPYDYFSDRTTMNTPMGPVRFLSTFEITPTPRGCFLELRIGAPRTAKERRILETMRDPFDASFSAGLEKLEADLAAEMDARPEIGETEVLPTDRVTA